MISPPSTRNSAPRSSDAVLDSARGPPCLALAKPGRAAAVGADGVGQWLLLTYQLARRMFGRATGLLAGIVLASAFEFCMLARAATPDATLLTFTMLTFYLFWTRHENGSRKWWRCRRPPRAGWRCSRRGRWGLRYPGWCSWPLFRVEP